MTLQPFEVRSVTLTGRIVRLEPLDVDRHLTGIAAVGLDPATWRFTIDRPADVDALRAYLDAAAREQEAGRQLPFVTHELATGWPIGMSRFMAIEPAHRRLEIGHTWVAPGGQRRGINAEAKLLMLAHAFDTLGAHRVEFKTHAANEKARAALEGIGAAYEGTFRKHMVMPDGSFRDSAWYAIVDDDWPAARERLETLVARHAG
jgi:RimJ/RimL family protein N-acetyltransferase